MAMKIQPELLTKTAFDREVERRALDQSFSARFIKTCNCVPDNKNKRRLKYTYGIVQGIDSGLSNNKIQNTDSANRMRNIAMSMTTSYMVRNKIVDIDILDAENISLEQVADQYTNDYHRTQLMVESIQNNEFIKNAIHDLAKDGKPFKSKNHDEIHEAESKIEEFELKLTGASGGMTFYYETMIRQLENKIQDLKRDEFLNGDFSIEDICFKVVTDWNRNSLREAIWYLSKTAQNKLIRLIVKCYKHMYVDEISAYRKKKNSDRRKESMKKYNKKTLSAEDKLELVQLGKADGITQKEVAALIGCSVRTVQYYWNTAS